jgi:transposase-like protein
MLKQPRNPRGFGVDDKPRCPNCGELTFLTRRAPAAEYALEYERQTFTCPGCERQFERVVDAEGKRRLSPGLDAGAFFDAIVQTGNKTCRD